MSSIADQREQAFEVVIVDADSTDGTVDRIQAAKDELAIPIRLEVAAERIPIGEARNLAVRLARAPNVAFLSADIELDERWTEQALTSLEEADMVFSRQVHDPRDWTLGAAVRGLRYHFPEGKTDDPLRYASNAAAAYRREVVEDLPIDPDVVAVDDLLLAERAARAGYEAVYNPEMIAYHHDVVDARGELSKSIREARGWGLNVRELGPMSPILAWGLALAIGLALLVSPASLIPTSPAAEAVLLSLVFWAPAIRRIPRALGKMPLGPLVLGVVVGPLFDLVFLLNYARGLLEARGSEPNPDPGGIER